MSCAVPSVVMVLKSRALASPRRRSTVTTSRGEASVLGRHFFPVRDQGTERTKQETEEIEPRRRKDPMSLERAAAHPGEEARVGCVAHHDVPSPVERHGEEWL